MKNQYRGGYCLKWGRGVGLGQFVDLRGSLSRKKGLFFSRGEGG